MHRTARLPSSTLGSMSSHSYTHIRREKVPRTPFCHLDRAGANDRFRIEMNTTRDLPTCVGDALRGIQQRSSNSAVDAHPSKLAGFANLCRSHRPNAVRHNRIEVSVARLSSNRRHRIRDLPRLRGVGYEASAKRLRQHGHSPSNPLASADSQIVSRQRLHQRLARRCSRSCGR